MKPSYRYQGVRGTDKNLTHRRDQRSGSQELSRIPAKKGTAYKRIIGTETQLTGKIAAALSALGDKTGK